MPYNDKGEFYWEPLQDTNASHPNRPRKRSGLPLLLYRMNNEQRAGFKIALEYGARQTAVAIRANKSSLGAAIVHASQEIGINRMVCALAEVNNPEWSLCAIRYALGITCAQREVLAETIDAKWLGHARWVLDTMTQISDKERQILRWLVSR